MANYKTGSQRYNDRMDKIFAKSEELGNHSLHSKTEAQGKAIKKKVKPIYIHKGEDKLVSLKEYKGKSQYM